ncbi:MAG: HAMP domain-containing sensor histidine kinase [bacterium]|nr:HAMP domain-containing sensor histidine kinase [bacterium]
MSFRSVPNTTPETAFRSFLYGGSAMLLAFNLFFLVKSLLTDNFVPIVPIIAGIFTAAGLLFIVYAEHQARQQDRREHRRISRVAHQLESPLVSLESDLAQLLENADSLPAAARLKLKHMSTSSKVLLENIRDVFLTLQAQAGGLKYEIRNYDLCTLVKEAIDGHQSIAQARNVEIKFKAHCHQAPVKLDRRFFNIVINHLLDNAVLYTLKPGLVNVNILRGKNSVRIMIRDRGIGISEKDASKIFLPFARGTHASQFDPDGIGVGLTLSRLLLRRINGQLNWRNNHHGMGTEFIISLPLAKKPVRSQPILGGG